MTSRVTAESRLMHYTDIYKANKEKKAQEQDELTLQDKPLLGEKTQALCKVRPPIYDSQRIQTEKERREAKVAALKAKYQG